MMNKLATALDAQIPASRATRFFAWVIIVASLLALAEAGLSGSLSLNHLRDLGMIVFGSALLLPAASSKQLVRWTLFSLSLLLMSLGLAFKYGLMGLHG